MSWHSFVRAFLEHAIASGHSEYHPAQMACEYMGPGVPVHSIAPALGVGIAPALGVGEGIGVRELPPVKLAMAASRGQG